MASGLALIGALSGCSMVPDEINPVEWYKGASDAILGRDRPETPVATPRAAKSDKAEAPAASADKPSREPAQGLIADPSRKYSEPVRREPAPTKPLARRTAPAETTQVAAAEQQAPAAPAYQPSLDSRMPVARDTGPSAPPAVAPGGPPARPNIPEVVPRGNTVQDQFQRRLAESQSAMRADQVAMPGGSGSAGEAGFELKPPSGMQKSRGARGVVAPPAPSATFEVAALSFADTGARLSEQDRAAIKEVARLYKKTGGTIRVVGRAGSPSAMHADAVRQVMGGLDASLARANAVAKALSQAGVPASKILVGADPVPAGYGADASGASVFLDY
jgi:outer membrane protein OmpA-like peptidoglycan-associated protein